MKASERFFKFPIRIYEPKQVEDNEIEEILGKKVRTTPKSVIGHARVIIEDISSWSDELTFHRKIEDVKTKGFNVTEINMKNGDMYYSTWSMERFEEEFDKHAEILEEFKRAGNTSRIGLPPSTTEE